MERSLTIKFGSIEMELSDLDQDNEIEVSITDDFDECQSIYLNKEDLISISKHIEYLLSK